jgi:PAS domain-containing protein
MYIVPIVHFGSFLAEALLIILIFSNNPRGQINRACALLIFTLAVWSFFYGLINLAHTEEEAHLFVNGAIIGMSGFPVAALWFYLIYSHTQRVLKNRAIILGTVFLPALFVYWQWSGATIFSAEKAAWGWAMVWAPGLYLYTYVAYFTVMLGICCYLLISYALKMKAFRQKRQSLLMLLFGGIAILFGLVTGVFYQLLGTLAYPQLTDMSGLIWSIGIVYAVSKYGMMRITPIVAADEILGTMTESVLLLDENGKIIYANGANTSLLGIRGNKLKGSDFNSIVLDRKKADELLARSTVTGVRAQCEMSYLSKQGSPYRCWYRRRP